MMEYKTQTEKQFDSSDNNKATELKDASFGAECKEIKDSVRSPDGGGQNSKSSDLKGLSLGAESREVKDAFKDAVQKQEGL